MPLKCVLLMLMAGCGLSADAAVRIVPNPQYFEAVKHSLRLAPGSSVVDSDRAGREDQACRRVLADRPCPGGCIVESVRSICRRRHGGSTGNPSVELHGRPGAPPLALNLLDREVLAESHRYGQSYVIRTPDAQSLWVIGNSDQGVLFGAMTVLQLIRRVAKGTEIQGVYVRDYPDFEFRAAADWLLNVEANRWALDRGQGVEAFAQLCERKLDADAPLQDQHGLHGRLWLGAGATIQRIRAVDAPPQSLCPRPRHQPALRRLRGGLRPCLPGRADLRRCPVPGQGRSRTASTTRMVPRTAAWDFPLSTRPRPSMPPSWGLAGRTTS